MTQAWVVRAGKHGERDEWAIENGYTGGGWGEVPDLTTVTTRDAMEHVVDDTFKGSSPGRLASYTGQLWALRGRINTGDLMVLPLKSTRQIAIGRVRGDYRYLADELNPQQRHVLPVEWSDPVPRAAIKQDLLYTLGSAISIFSPSRNNALARLEYVIVNGSDPGASGASSPSSTSNTHTADTVDVPETEVDVAEVAQDQIASRIGEEFAGHGLAHLVSELLRAEGFHTDEAPPGPDGGIDITAGRGALGLESPKLIVQVKSGQVGSEVVAQLNGLVTTHGADYGLIATWAGLSKPARETLRHQRFRVKVWDSTDIVEAVLRSYDRLPDSITARVPLRRVWMLRDDT